MSNKASSINPAETEILSAVNTLMVWERPQQYQTMVQDWFFAYNKSDFSQDREERAINSETYLRLESFFTALAHTFAQHGDIIDQAEQERIDQSIRNVEADSAKK